MSDQHVVTLSDGTRALVRPIRPEDKEKLAEGLERLSPQSHYLRFTRPVRDLTERELAFLTEVDYHDHYAWAALALDLPDQPALGIARYVRDPGDPVVAEAAVAVVDEFQGRGLGKILLHLLARTAMSHGITRFRAWVLPENRKVTESLLRRGADLHYQEGLVQVDVPLSETLEHEDSTLHNARHAGAGGEPTTEPKR